MRRAATFFLLWILFAGGIFGVFAATYWYWDMRQAPTTITLEGDTLAGPRDPLTFRFSRPMRPQSLANRVRLEPLHPFRTEWHNHDQTLLLIPEADWPLESTYQLVIGPGQTKWLGTTPTVMAKVHSPSYPKIVTTLPVDGAEDVRLGIEDPIEVTFDRSVKDFFIDFRLTPPVEMIYEYDPDKTSFAILPVAPLSEGAKHELAVFAKWRGAPDSAYQSLGKVSFATLPPAPKAWNANLALRVEEAKRLTRPKKTDGKYIDINLGSQVMTLFDSGQALDAYLISSGLRGMDTPRGEYAIRNKAPRPWSKQYGLYMPYWQAITPDGKYGIHELPEWPGGYKEGANHLGTPVSHGCVRLGIGAAARVYAWSDIGTPIVIY